MLFYLLNPILCKKCLAAFQTNKEKITAVINSGSLVALEMECQVESIALWDIYSVK